MTMFSTSARPRGAGSRSPAASPGEGCSGSTLHPSPRWRGVITLVGDLTDPSMREEALSILGTVNIVLSDASPRLSGNRSYDQARAIGLGEDALSFACLVLKPGGNLVMKSFQGEDFSELLDETRQHFHSVRTFRCRAVPEGEQ